jgi:hypothetical protein
MRLLFQPLFQLHQDIKPMLIPSQATVDHHHTNRLLKPVKSAETQLLSTLNKPPTEELKRLLNTLKLQEMEDQRLFTALLPHTEESQLQLLPPTPPEMEELKPSAQVLTQVDNRPLHQLSHQPAHHTSHPLFLTHHQTVDQ